MRAATRTTNFPHPTSHNLTWHATLNFFFLFFSSFSTLELPTPRPESGRESARSRPAGQDSAVLAGEGPDSAILRPVNRDPTVLAGEGLDSAFLRPADRDPAVLAEERTAGSPNPEMQSPAVQIPSSGFIRPPAGKREEEEEPERERERERALVENEKKKRKRKIYIYISYVKIPHQVVKTW
jgi:hypothetical protein